MIRRPLATVGVLCLLTVALEGTALSPAFASPAAAVCAPIWRQVPSPSPSSVSILREVAAVNARDVWAVGHQRDDVTQLDLTLTEHWDGAAWTTVPSPNGPEGIGLLLGVGVVSSADVWAVGDWYDAQHVSDTQPLALHWGGSVWTVVPAPHPGATSELVGVWGAKRNDVWAVGSYAARQETHFLMEHWNGSRWSLVSLPELTSADLFRSISGTARDDVWAVGQSGAKTVAFHWDGITWTQIPTPTPGVFNEGLYDVSARAADDVWATGYSESENALHFWSKWHWDGTSWTTEANDPQMPDMYAAGVAASSEGDVWAVGNFGIDNPSVDHWDGTNWSRVAGPVVPYGELFDAAVVEGTVWAVGYASDGNGGSGTYIARVCPVSVGDGGFFPPSTRFGYGTRAFWTVGPGSSQERSVTDASGMGLFDSGLLPAGASFDFVFTAGGTYTVVDAASSLTSTVGVSITSSPKQGGVTTTFHVVYAIYGAQPGYIYDVQIKRPSATDFADWKMNQVPDESDFIPDAGAGTYSFRSRLRSTTNGAASDWSPATSVAVS